MLADLDRHGVLILRDFYPKARCDELKTRALELVDEPRAQRLTALGPIEPCRPKLTIHGARGQLVQCCSVCHVAAGDVPTAEPATRAVAKSCMVCHRKAAETESLRSLENEVFDSEGLRG